MNLVLIGMPGSGKSAVGGLLAAATGRRFLDSDALVEEKAGQSISAIFAAHGEACFRATETAAILEAAAAERAVIATGGGAVLRAENMEALQKTGVIFFLDRPVEALLTLPQGDRPLLAGDANRIYQLYTNRISLYRKYGQYCIKNPKSPEAAAEEILQIIGREGIL
ncbi:MAG: shikimate kinase [Pseudoflavonifractor sp.]